MDRNAALHAPRYVNSLALHARYNRTEGARAIAMQRSDCHTFVPGKPASLDPGAGIPLRVATIRKLALRGITLRVEFLNESKCSSASYINPEIPMRTDQILLIVFLDLGLQFSLPQ